VLVDRDPDKGSGEAPTQLSVWSAWSPWPGWAQSVVTAA